MVKLANSMVLREVPVTCPGHSGQASYVQGLWGPGQQYRMKMGPLPKEPVCKGKGGDGNKHVQPVLISFSASGIKFLTPTNLKEKGLILAQNFGGFSPWSTRSKIEMAW